MSEMRYFIDLERDFLAVCPQLEETDFDGNEYNCAMSVLEKGRRVLRADSPQSLQDPHMELSTALGRRIVELRNKRARVNEPDVGPLCCQEAEWKLAYSLLPRAVNNPLQRSPVLLTLHDRAVAVGKQWGAPSWYGLEDIPERGIYAGAFHAIPDVPIAKHFPKAESAYRYALPDVSEPRLIRFSIYATPQITRRYMRSMENEALIVRSTTHEKIVSLCSEYLSTAVECTPSED